MKRIGWQVILGFFLVVLSAGIYFIHYLIFKDPHHIFIYLLGDIAFVPIEVLLVTLIIHRLLKNREKRAMLNKMNMVIGAFFSEIGTNLLKLLSEFDPSLDELKNHLLLTDSWSDKEFFKASKLIKKHAYVIDSQRGDLGGLRKFLIERLNFMLRLLENPNLLEHDSFTELLWAVTHLTEELSHRQDVTSLSDTDYKHLSGDINRAYSLLVFEWVAYMKHLSNNYPYLFSLAIRTNPFNPSASVEFK